MAVLRAANTSLGVALLAELAERAAHSARARLGHRDRRDPSPDEGRRAVGHGADAGRGGGARPESTAESRARPRRHRPQARDPARSALLRFAAAPSRATTTCCSSGPTSG